MKTLILALAMTTLVAGAANAAPVGSDRTVVLAEGGQQDGWGQDRGGNHQWQRGERMGRNDWSSAQPIDYRQHHLRQPPRGYEWRESNGQYVLAAVATGVIASIILSR